MSSSILFDNIVITDSVEQARNWAAQTFDLKVSKLDKESVRIIFILLSYSPQGFFKAGTNESAYIFFTGNPIIYSGDWPDYMDKFV